MCVQVKKGLKVVRMNVMGQVNHHTRTVLYCEPCTWSIASACAATAVNLGVALASSLAKRCLRMDNMKPEHASSACA
jgi:hypothetical protein